MWDEWGVVWHQSNGAGGGAEQREVYPPCLQRAVETDQLLLDMCMGSEH